MGKLKTEFKKIEKQYEAEKTTAIQKMFLDVLELREFAQGENFVMMDGYKLTNLSVDEKNHLTCEFKGKIPLEYLEKFRNYIIDVIEQEHACPHRAGIELFIEYFKRFHKTLSEKAVQDMCKTDDRDKKKEDSGFREWLIGDSYQTGGNLKDFEKWDYQEFGK